MLLDRLVGVVGTRDQVQLGEDLGAVGAVGAQLVLRIELLRDLERLRRRLVVLEARAIDLAEAVEQTDLELVEHRAALPFGIRLIMSRYARSWPFQSRFVVSTLSIASNDFSARGIIASGSFSGFAKKLSSALL